MKYRVQQMAGIKLSTPTFSVCLEIFVLIFSFLVLKIGNIRQKDNPHSECPWILGWSANDASTHHFKISLPLAQIVSGRLLVPLRYCIRFTNLSQLSSLVTHTLVVRNVMAVKVSNLTLLLAYKIISTRLWNSTTFSWSSFVQSLFTIKISLRAAIDLVTFPFYYSLLKGVMIFSKYLSILIIT